MNSEYQSAPTYVDDVSRLMAEEGINIKVDPTASTAYFDFAANMLVIPIWNVQPRTSIFLRAHEVSHKLFTPEAGWHENCKKYGPTFAPYLNIIEDARVDRLMQKRYAGLTIDYSAGYRELFNMDIMGIKGRKLSEFNLIDRVNLGLKFPWMLASLDRLATSYCDKAHKTETFEDVVALAKEIFNSAVENEKSKNQRQEPKSQTGSAPQEKSETQEKSEPTNDQDSQENQTPSEDKKESFPEDSKESKGLQASDGEKSEDKPTEGGEAQKAKPQKAEEQQSVEGDLSDEMLEALASETEESQREGMDNLVAQNRRTDSNIVDYQMRGTAATVKDVLAKTARWADIRSNAKKLGSDYSLYSRFLADNKQYIGTLVNEFNMRKAARDDKYRHESRSGVINSKNLHAYKFRPDIFVSKVATRDHKNHGMVFMIDNSFSMQGNWWSTMTNLFCLVEFCKRTGIEFEAYTFTNKRGAGAMERKFNTQFEDDCHSVVVRKILDSKMRKSVIADIFCTVVRGRGAEWQFGGTPLDVSMIIGAQCAKDMKRRLNLEKVEYFFLSDGDATANLSHRKYWEKHSRVVDKENGVFFELQERTLASTVAAEYCKALGFPVNAMFVAYQFSHAISWLQQLTKPFGSAPCDDVLARNRLRMEMQEKLQKFGGAIDPRHVVSSYKSATLICLAEDDYKRTETYGAPTMSELDKMLQEMTANKGRSDVRNDIAKRLIDYVA